MFLLDHVIIKQHPQFNFSDETAGFTLRKDRLTVDDNLKLTMISWKQNPALNDVLVIRQYFFCQPDSIGQVVSYSAVFDFDPHLSPHWKTVRVIHHNRCRHSVKCQKLAVLYEYLDHLC